MWACIFALGVLVWMWAAASRHVLAIVAGKAGYAVRSVWLSLFVGMGVLAVLALAWFVLPDSVLSKSWTRKELEITQQLTALLVIVMGIVGFLRGQRLLVPVASADSSLPSVAQVQKQKRQH